MFRYLVPSLALAVILVAWMAAVIEDVRTLVDSAATLILALWVASRGRGRVRQPALARVPVPLARDRSP
jgi:hypothetical protein